MSHHHHHVPGGGWALRLSLAATVAFTLFEVWAGFYSHSLSLLSDAGHNFTDALALFLAAVGLHWQQKPADQSRTYGYQRAGVLTAFINALTLVGIALLIFWEAGKRFVSPETVNEELMGGVAIAAMVLNGAVMIALHRGQKSDMNIRAAFIHMLGDLLGAAGILVGAFVIRYTGWIYIDPVLSIAIGFLIIYSAIGIIRESLNILLEGLPQGMNLLDITRAMADVDGVLEVHDLHIWSLGANTHALSSHVLIDDMPPSESSKILGRLNDVLCAFGIHHTTIQFEHVPCFLSNHGCQITESAQGHDHGHQH
jgi:cobalt-zinc-cadmium efflux system protein